MLRFVLPFVLLVGIGNCQSKNPIRGPFCARNQVANKITVYEDGAIEAECGPLPCGTAGEQCIDDMSACKAETDVYSGMKWAKNGQSVLLRCCTLNVPNKIYIGTDLVSLGSYYTGGYVAKTEMYNNMGPEYDFVANIRAEQGGVRIWAYRILCPKNGTETAQQPNNEEPAQRIPEETKSKSDAHRQYLLRQIADQQQQQQQSAVAVAASVDEEPIQTPVNPLQYRPARMMAARQRDSPLPAASRVL